MRCRLGDRRHRLAPHLLPHRRQPPPCSRCRQDTGNRPPEGVSERLTISDPLPPARSPARNRRPARRPGRAVPAGTGLLRPSSRHGNLDDVQTRPRAGPRDGSSFHQAAGQPPDVAPPHGPIVQLLDAHVDVPVAARQSCWCTQPGGSPSRLPTPFPSMPASCAAFDCRGRAPTMSVAAGCASVTGRPPPRPECS